MPTREQVRRLLDDGLGYAEAGRALGIPPGQAYLIATGQPADGGSTPSPRQEGTGRLLPASQHLPNPPPDNPATSESVRKWIAARAAADDAMRAAAARRTPTPPEPVDPESNLDATVVLTRQHNQVRVLQEQLDTVPGSRSGGTQSDFTLRKSLVELITGYLSRHETAEQELFWPAVRAALPDGDAWADAAQAQEQEGKDLLTELGRLEPDTGEFDDHVQKLGLALRRHVTHEEQVFLRLQEAMPREERVRLGEQLLTASKRRETQEV